MFIATKQPYFLYAWEIWTNWKLSLHYRSRILGRKRHGAHVKRWREDGEKGRGSLSRPFVESRADETEHAG